MTDPASPTADQRADLAEPSNSTNQPESAEADLEVVDSDSVRGGSDPQSGMATGRRSYRP